MDRIAGPLRAALAGKGYETLTPVQEAVLADEAEGRDLLVSAQTGSGKTVAFGLAIAPQVLGGLDELLPAEQPLALVIAPTRELALQVRREFEWLFANAIVASCVGGMDYRTERRALERGAHLVVGTPGRLRDHVERGSLDLSALTAVVLDEADEMLDMGFAEDLEFLLGAAPEDKRVLMFSATVPKEIADLAKSYQRDALRIEVKSAATQHADIDHRAVQVTLRDKEPAIFNLLRWHDARCAIVFAKTRANVNHLHARMVNRGFPVVALSGELSQTERLHALQALRDGRARVCIATDVAARGIDLPGLDLVIHADLPGSSETLLHRSGRTGRAGRKGTSVMIVPQNEVRKANRLLQGAKVVADWGKAPGADAVQSREDERLMGDAALTEGPGEEAAVAASLLQAHGPDAVAAAFVRLWRAKRSAPEELAEDLPPPAALPVRERGEFGAAVWYRLSVGHSGRAEARWLLPKICEAGGIAKDGIGAIRVQQDMTFVQIAEPLAPRFGAATEIEPGLTMERMAEAPDFSARPRPARDDARPPRRDPAKTPYKPKPSRFVEEGEGGDAAARPARDEDRRPAPRAERAPREDWKPREDRQPRSDWKPREDRPREDRPREDRPREDRPREDWKPREDRPRRDESFDRRPRQDGAPARKPWAPREDRGDRPAPRGDKPGYKSAGFRSHGGDEGKPARAAGYKSHASEGGYKRREDYAPRDEAPRKARAEGGAEGRPFVKRDGAKPYAAKAGGAKPYAPKTGEARSEGRSWGAKSHAGDRAEGAKPFGRKPAGKSFDKPFAKPAGKPAAPRGDARDTSKRFVPPKKPRV